MIDVRTLKFMQLMDKLAAKTEYGFKELYEFSSDKERAAFNGIIYDRNNNMVLADIVCGEVFFSYFGDYDYTIEVQFKKNCKPTIIVSFPDSDELIVIRDGSWSVIQ